MRISEIMGRYDIPRADAQILVASALQQTRSWVFAHENDALTRDEESRCSALLERRRSGEPVAYITETKEFFGRDFAVDPRVLIPRPATEGLIELVLGLYKKSIHLPIKTWTITPLDTEIVAAVFLRDTQSLPQSLIDIGTGSGCIAVTLAAELPGLTIVASDMDAGALSLAAENARKHGVASRIHFVQADGAAVLQNATEPFFVVSNPPYIPDDAFVDADVLREPRQALFGGPDGADLVRALASAALTHPLCAGIAIECRREQVEKLAVQDS